MFDNEFFQGGLLLAIIAYIGAYLRHLPALAWHWVERNYTTMIIFDNHDPRLCPSIGRIMIIFDNHDPTYAWAEAWLHEHLHRMSTSHRRITRSNIDSDDNKAFRVLPRPGFYTLRRYNRRIMIWYWRKRLDSVFNDNTAYSESIYIWYWGKDEKIFRDIVEEGQRLSVNQNPNKVTIYSNHYGSWKIYSIREKRNLDTIAFAKGLGEELINDLNIFLSSREMYVNLGIQWKRGYLFHGPPGNGKSSTIFALASHLGMPLYVLQLSDLGGDQEMMSLISKIPNNSLLAIEDIDSSFEGRTSNNDKISFSTFLNLFDGVISKDGQIIFVTTNKFDVLDKALIREGRIDKIFKFDNADEKQVREMAAKFSNGKTVDIKSSFKGTPLATIQEYYLQKMKDPQSPRESE